MSELLLAAHNLTRRVGENVLVEDVSFDVCEDDVFVIFGPSGSGKSTLLRLLNRLDEPTSGTVLLGSTDYRSLPPQELRRRVGYVPQQPALRPGTVRDNVTWGRHLRGVDASDSDMNDLLARLDLEGYAQRHVGSLSGGEAQRVAIARTLYNEPEIVLLDEPASSLDAGAARHVEELVHEMIEDYVRAAVLVTHDAGRARRLGTRGVRLSDGRLIEAAAVDDLLDPAQTDA